MGIKDFFLKQALKSKLKDLPAEQRDLMQGLIEEHPEFFAKIGEEVKKRTKRGESELVATLAVMREHQAEFQKLMRR